MAGVAKDFLYQMCRKLFSKYPGPVYEVQKDECYGFQAEVRIPRTIYSANGTGTRKTIAKTNAAKALLRSLIDKEVIGDVPDNILDDLYDDENELPRRFWHTPHTPDDSPPSSIVSSDGTSSLKPSCRKSTESRKDSESSKSPSTECSGSTVSMISLESTNEARSSHVAGAIEQNYLMLINQRLTALENGVASLGTRVTAIEAFLHSPC